jgi:hypothetical protein
MSPLKSMDGVGVTSELRAFLLGALSNDESERIEQSLLSDDDLYELLLAVEEELIDEYLEGTLSRSQARSFRHYLERLPDGRKRIDFARDLRRGLGRGREAGASGEWLRSLFRWRPPAWAWAVVLAGVSIAIYVTFTVTPWQKPLLLASGLTRGEGELPSARLGGSREPLEVLLELGFSSHDRYRATLYDEESRGLYQRSGLKIRVDESRIVVPFAIPSARIAPGDYSIVLDGDSTARHPTANSTLTRATSFA